MQSLPGCSVISKSSGSVQASSREQGLYARLGAAEALVELHGRFAATRLQDVLPVREGPIRIEESPLLERLEAVGILDLIGPYIRVIDGDAGSYLEDDAEQLVRDVEGGLELIGKEAAFSAMSDNRSSVR
jgi:hypothetical protein